MNDQPERQWRVGDVANGHRLDADFVWRPVMPAPPPAPPTHQANPSSKRWFKRPFGIVGIVFVTLFAIGSLSNDPDSSAKDGASTATDASDVSPATSDDEAEALERVAETEPDSESESAEPSASADPRPTKYLVTDVVDGDTLDLEDGQTVRIVGIDAPEVGECGYQRANDKMVNLVLGQRVRLIEADEDTDRYGRLLRYVNVHGKDAGLRLIESGLAIARYDSRDGYGAHPREDDYIAADRETKDETCAPKPTPKPQPFVGSSGGSNDCMAGYSPCLPVRADLDCGEIGYPVTVTGGDPYRLDADGDGVGCDS